MRSSAPKCQKPALFPRLKVAPATAVARSAAELEREFARLCVARGVFDRQRDLGLERRLFPQRAAYTRHLLLRQPERDLRGLPGLEPDLGPLEAHDPGR